MEGARQSVYAAAHANSALRRVQGPTDRPHPGRGTEPALPDPGDRRDQRPADRDQRQVEGPTFGAALRAQRGSPAPDHRAAPRPPGGLHAARVEAGVIERIGGRDRRFSTLFVENLPPIVARLLAAWPRGRAYNCCDPATTWGDFVAAHAAALGCSYREERRGLGAILGALGDKHALFVLTGSAFGAHYPADALSHDLALPALRPWQEGVREGVAAFCARSRG